VTTGLLELEVVQSYSQIITTNKPTLATSVRYISFLSTGINLLPVINIRSILNGITVNIVETYVVSAIVMNFKVK